MVLLPRGLCVALWRWRVPRTRPVMKRYSRNIVRGAIFAGVIRMIVTVDRGMLMSMLSRRGSIGGWSSVLAAMATSVFWGRCMVAIDGGIKTLVTCMSRLTGVVLLPMFCVVVVLMLMLMLVAVASSRQSVLYPSCATGAWPLIDTVSGRVSMAADMLAMTVGMAMVIYSVTHDKIFPERSNLRCVFS